MKPVRFAKSHHHRAPPKLAWELCFWWEPEAILHIPGQWSVLHAHRCALLEWSQFLWWRCSLHCHWHFSKGKWWCWAWIHDGKNFGVRSIIQQKLLGWSAEYIPIMVMLAPIMVAWDITTSGLKWLFCFSPNNGIINVGFCDDGGRHFDDNRHVRICLFHCCLLV